MCWIRPFIPLIRPKCSIACSRIWFEIPMIDSLWPSRARILRWVLATDNGNILANFAGFRKFELSLRISFSKLIWKATWLVRMCPTSGTCRSTRLGVI